LLWLTVLAGFSVFLLLRPAPINIVVVVLAWITWGVLRFRRSTVAPAKDSRYLAGMALFASGIVSTLGSMLVAIAHEMDPVGPSRTEWFPYAFFGGLISMAVGILIVVMRRA
jgi:hypothetical protein